LFLVLWGFIRLPLILPRFSAGLPSILVLKNQLLRAFLRHLAFSNLSQDFLPDPKPLRTYSTGILAIGKIPLAFPLSLPGKQPLLRLPHQTSAPFGGDFSDSGAHFINPEGLA
jgi:hypothetical protein